MNTDPSDRILNDLLRDWALTRQADSTRVEALTQRVVSDFEQARKSDSLPGSGRAARLTRSWAIVLTACAALGLVLLWWNQSSTRSGQAIRMPAPVSPSSLLETFTDEQRAAKWQLLRELNDVYEHRVAWFVETSDRLGLELQTNVIDRPETIETTPPVVVRVVIQTRPRGGSEWAVVRSLDIVTSSEQVVRISPESAEQVSLNLWVFRLPDGMLHVESQGSFDVDSPIRWDSLSPVSEGQAIHIAHGTTEQAEFQVWQVAATLAPASS